MKRDVRTWMPWVTLIVDVLLINIALPIAYWLRYDLQLFRGVDPANNVPYSVYWPMAGLLTVVLILTCRHEGAYDLGRNRSLSRDLYGVLNATTTAIMLLVVLVFFLQATVLLTYHLRLRRRLDPRIPWARPCYATRHPDPHEAKRPRRGPSADHRRGEVGRAVMRKHHRSAGARLPRDRIPR